MLTYTELQQDLANASVRFNKELTRLSERTATRMKDQAIKNAHVYPKKRTGLLVSSIQGYPVDFGREQTIYVFADTDIAYYAEFVESGTSRMKPRLYIKRAIERIEPSFQKQAEKLLQKALKRRGG